MDPVTAAYVEIRPNRVGQARAYVAGTRVRVLDLYVMSDLHGLSPDQIIEGLPHLTLAQVHGALAYYFDHRDEIVQQLREEVDAGVDLRAKLGPGPLSRKLDSHLTTKTEDDSVSS